jgi:hypothetical protein
MNFAQDAVKLGAFDVSALRTAVRALGETDWTADSSRQQAFDAHIATQTLKLIADADFRHADPTVHPPFRMLEPMIEPLMAHVRRFYLQTLRQRSVAEKHGPGYFIRALLTRLPPGAEIRPHIDDGYSLKRCHRIHVPLVTSPQTLFRVGDTRFNMGEGEMWEINNRRLHAVTNGGDAARIHLIMDYVQPGETVFDLDGPLVA